MRRLKRLAQRLLVIGIGIAAVWLIVLLYVDVASQRLPLIFALAGTYAVGAYLILPRAIRLGARVLKRGRVPAYTLTGDGLPGDPVNIVLIGTIGQLRAAFAQLGWTEADPLGIASSWKMAQAFVLNRPYPSAPFSTLYLFDRGQDVGFQRAIDNSPRKRHHVRFWGLPLDRVEATLDTAAFWLETGRPSDEERALWVGAVTKDVGFGLTKLSFQITHATDADTNAERDFLVKELEKSGVITGVHERLAGEGLPQGKVNRYVTDGMVAVGDLTPA